MENRAFLDRLAALARRGGLVVEPFLGAEAIWDLAAAVAAETGARVRVLAPPPPVTWIANDKANFEDLVTAVLGPEGTHYVVNGSKQWITNARCADPFIPFANVDGTGLQRLTNHPAIDTSPTWSPNSQQIAFTSDRTGAPQIYVVGADGTGLRRLTYESYCDRPTWSPAPFNEIAYSSQTSPGSHDIKVLDLATNEVRQLTFGLGSNESPSYAPNGRHIAFMSTRNGSKQIYTIGRDGRGLRRVTSAGNNEMPSWSR